MESLDSIPLTIVKYSEMSKQIIPSEIKDSINKEVLSTPKGYNWYAKVVSYLENGVKKYIILMNDYLTKYCGEIFEDGVILHEQTHVFLNHNCEEAISAELNEAIALARQSKFLDENGYLFRPLRGLFRPYTENQSELEEMKKYYQLFLDAAEEIGDEDALVLAAASVNELNHHTLTEQNGERKWEDIFREKVNSF